MLDKIKEAAKSIGTLLSGIIVAVLAIGIDDPDWARGLAIAAAVVGAIVVWATPNKETDAQRIIREAGEQALDTRTYEDLGGGEYPERVDVLAEDHTSFPEAGTLYEPGEEEGERFGDKIETNAYVGKEPVSGNAPLTQDRNLAGDLADKDAVFRVRPVSGNDLPEDPPVQDKRDWIG